MKFTENVHANIESIASAIGKDFKRIFPFFCLEIHSSTLQNSSELSYPNYETFFILGCKSHPIFKPPAKEFDLDIIPSRETEPDAGKSSSLVQAEKLPAN